jgi:ATP-binding cassette subfamily A (ABC1) protein 3
MIGYCPQFDAIYEHLTVREHLWFYATIKGVRSDLKADLVTRQIRELDLVQYEHVQAGKLSGGNKRKLSCAMALIGNPPLVLLDEPSTGVDP